MTKQIFVRQLILASAGLVIVLLIFYCFPIDIWLEDQLYNFPLHHWWVEKEARLPKLLFYIGPKRLFIGAAVFLLLCLVFARHTPWVRDNHRGLSIVLLSMILVPSVINGLKSVTNIPCPKDIQHYGGTHPYVSLFEHNQKTAQPLTRVACYPAGHASGGFSLLSLLFLFRTRRAKALAASAALGIGWITGIYKMLIGDHFLSHTIVSMVLAWIIVLIIARLVHQQSAMTQARHEEGAVNEGIEANKETAVTD